MYMILYSLNQKSEKQSLKSGVTDSDGKKSKVSQKAASPVKKKEEFIVGKWWWIKTKSGVGVRYVRKKKGNDPYFKLFPQCENLVLFRTPIILNGYKGNMKFIFV